MKIYCGTCKQETEHFFADDPEKRKCRVCWAKDRKEMEEAVRRAEELERFRNAEGADYPDQGDLFDIAS